MAAPMATLIGLHPYAALCQKALGLLLDTGHPGLSTNQPIRRYWRYRHPSCSAQGGAVRSDQGPVTAPICAREAGGQVLETGCIGGDKGHFDLGGGGGRARNLAFGGLF